MKVLVTGGAGFIGSHIVDALVTRGHHVSVVDDLSTGNREWLSQDARLHEIDIRSPALESVLARERPEVVIHQAARANVRESMRMPLLYADVNTLGSLNLLEQCRRQGVRRVVYASTGGAVYGEPLQLPVSEDHPARPLDPYGASKHFFEHYLRLYHVNYGVETVALRYPNVYGPRQDPFGEAGVVAIFTLRMLRGEHPVVNGDGKQERDFVHVSDITRANLLAIEAPWQGICNLGWGLGVSVNQIYDMLAGLTGFAGTKSHGPAKLGEVSRIYLDAGRAREALGWEPRITLPEGLRDTVEFFRARLEGKGMHTEVIKS